MVEHGDFRAVSPLDDEVHVPRQQTSVDHLIDAEVVTIPISSLRAALTPRIQGENEEHVRLLTISAHQLPPIIVHRDTMRVIDGAHRLRVATALGATRIQARFFTGDERDAFVLAVRLNAQHGLPLSLPDRLSAAAHIMRSHPEWSDRMIATLTGLTHKTVRGIRRRSGTEVPQLSFRRGQDGRIRPISPAKGRRLAAELIVERPEASLREISREAGIAIATVRDVRRRLMSGADPVPERHRGDREELPAEPDRRPVPPVATIEPRIALQHLRQDPSLRFSEVGRTVLRLLEAGSVDPGQWARLVTAVPPHCADLVVEIARACAHAYLQFAQQLEKNVRSAM